MKKTLFIFIILLAYAVAGYAASPLQGQQKQEAITAITKAVGEVKTMSGSFVQTKHLKLLSDKMVSKGSINFKHPDKLRWEYSTPYSYLFIFNGSKVYVGNKSRKDVIDTKNNKIFKEVARIMMNTVTGKALTKKDDFTVTIAADTKNWEVTLVPVKKELKQMFVKVILVFSKPDARISEINIFEKNGDRTSIQLTNVKYNGPVNENLFAIP